jgi:hypothetical protein
MATNVAYVQIASSNAYQFANASNNDLVMYPSAATQQFLLGTSNNAYANITMTPTDIDFVVQGSTSNSSHNFFTNNGANAAMTILGTGNVGFGTTQPTGRLHILGGNASSYQLLIDAQSNYGGIAIATASNTSGAQLAMAWTSGQFSTDAVANDVVLRNTNGKILIQNGTTVSAIVVTGNSVGIGMTNPGYKLDVAGNVRASNLDVNRTRISFGGTSDSNHILYNNQGNLDGQGAWDGIKWNTFNGLWVRGGPASGATPTTIAFFGSNGNVGIGSTTPAYRLDVGGTTRSSNFWVGSNTYAANTQDVFHVFQPSISGYSSNDFGITAGFGGYFDMCGLTWNIQNSGNNSFSRYNNNLMGWSFLNVSGGSMSNLSFRCYGAGFASNITPGIYTQPLMLGSNNINTPNLSINNNWAVPVYPLDVTGTMRGSNLLLGNGSNDAFNRMISAIDSTIGSATANSNVRSIIMGKGMNTNNALEMGYWHVGDSNSSNYSTLGHFGSTAIAWTAAGNVGIGTTNPGYKLDVLGSTRIYNNSNFGQLSVQSTFGGVGNTCSVDLFTYSNASLPPGVRLCAVDDGSFGGHFSVHTKPTGSTSNVTVERLRITNAGNVGVGITNPGYKLDVAGTMNATTIRQNGSLLAPWSSNLQARNHSTTQSISNVTDTVLLYDTADTINRGSAVLSYNNGVFTNTSGSTIVIMVTFSTSWATNGTGARACYIRLNGNASSRFGSLNSAAVSGDFTMVTGSSLISLANNDYISIMAYQNSGGALNSSANTAFPNKIQICLLNSQ